MNEDMVNGLSTDNNMAADLKMYITYVRSVPDGTGNNELIATPNPNSCYRGHSEITLNLERHAQTRPSEMIPTGTSSSVNAS